MKIKKVEEGIDTFVTNWFDILEEESKTEENKKALRFAFKWCYNQGVKSNK